MADDDYPAEWAEPANEEVDGQVPEADAEKPKKKAVTKIVIKPGKTPPSKKTVKAKTPAEPVEGDEASEPKDDLAKAMDSAVRAACGEAEPDAKRAKLDRDGAGGDGQKKKVTLKKAVAKEIQRLNDAEWEIRLGAIARHLSALDESLALEILAGVEEAAPEDATEWIKEAAKGAVETTQKQKEQDEADWDEWDRQELEAAVDRYGPVPQVVIDRIKQLNRSGKLEEPLKMTRVAGPLTAAGAKEALHCLMVLERRASSEEGIYTPNAYVQTRSRNCCTPVMQQVDTLNRGGAGKMDLLAPIKPDEIREALESVSEDDAMRMLERLEANILKIPDPTAWIKETAEKNTTAVAKEVIRLNKCGGLAQPINVSWALDGLWKLPEPQAMKILQPLSNRPAGFRNPTAYIRARCGVPAIPENKGKGKGKGKDKGKGKGKDKGKDAKGSGKAGWTDNKEAPEPADDDDKALDDFEDGDPGDGEDADGYGFEDGDPGDAGFSRAKAKASKKVITKPAWALEEADLDCTADVDMGDGED